MYAKDESYLFTETSSTFNRRNQFSIATKINILKNETGAGVHTITW